MNRQKRRAAAKADNLSNRSPAILIGSGLRYLQSGQFSEAEKCCRVILATDPDHADSFHLLGLISAKTDKYDQAIEFIAQAIKKNPNNADYFSNLGTMLQRQARFDEALKSFDLALSLKPDSTDTWIKLGNVMQKKERFEEAILAYDHVLELDPPRPGAGKNPAQANTLYKKGICFRHLMKREEACICFGFVLVLFFVLLVALFVCGWSLLV